ncbi:hypothetical protein DPEC_G00245610 [Dallia pectoralis]|uniref:Uncharacterized protein n=1 Tax=Dallia pectoralis TaxID=75939 RepID=A0ACC2FW57_DALPE|nr:hypothetical protein DPEC_G00245610 [Dallia pectoralis]
MRPQADGRLVASRLSLSIVYPSIRESDTMAPEVAWQRSFRHPSASVRGHVADLTPLEIAVTSKLLLRSFEQGRLVVEDHKSTSSNGLDGRPRQGFLKSKSWYQKLLGLERLIK